MHTLALCGKQRKPVCSARKFLELAAKAQSLCSHDFPPSHCRTAFQAQNVFCLVPTASITLWPETDRSSNILRRVPYPPVLPLLENEISLWKWLSSNKISLSFEQHFSHLTWGRVCIWAAVQCHHGMLYHQANRGTAWCPQAASAASSDRLPALGHDMRYAWCCLCMAPFQNAPMCMSWDVSLTFRLANLQRNVPSESSADCWWSMTTEYWSHISLWMEYQS